MKRIVVPFLLALLPVSAEAQRVTAPVEIESYTVTGSEDLLDSWGRSYLSLGTESDESMKLRRAIVETLCPSGKACQLDFQRPHFVVFPIPGGPMMGTGWGSSARSTPTKSLISRSRPKQCGGGARATLGGNGAIDIPSSVRFPGNCGGSLGCPEPFSPSSSARSASDSPRPIKSM